MHIPAAYFSETKLGKYQDVSKTIADHLRWRVIDEQAGATTGTELAATSPRAAQPTAGTRFWILGIVVFVLVALAAIKLLRKQ